MLCRSILDDHHCCLRASCCRLPAAEQRLSHPHNHERRAGAGHSGGRLCLPSVRIHSGRHLRGKSQPLTGSGMGRKRRIGPACVLHMGPPPCNDLSPDLRHTASPCCYCQITTLQFDSIEQAVVLCYVASTAVCKAVVVYERGAPLCTCTRLPAACPAVRAVGSCCHACPCTAADPCHLPPHLSSRLCHAAPAGLDGCSPPIAVLKKDTPRRDNSFVSPGVFTLSAMSITMTSQYQYFLCECSSGRRGDAVSRVCMDISCWRPLLEPCALARRACMRPCCKPPCTPLLHMLMRRRKRGPGHPANC